MLTGEDFNEGPQLPKKIRALASYREYTFAANGSSIAVFKRAHQVCPKSYLYFTDDRSS